MLRFRVIAAGTEQVLGPERPSLVIGRHPSCDLVVRHRAVSGRHCELRLHGGQLWVRDLESRHGTWVQDQRIRSVAIAGATTLRVATTPVRVVREVHASDAGLHTTSPIAKWRRQRRLIALALGVPLLVGGFALARGSLRATGPTFSTPAASTPASMRTSPERGARGDFELFAPLPDDAPEGPSLTPPEVAAPEPEDAPTWNRRVAPATPAELLRDPDIDLHAVSVGSPNAGYLEGALQMPESPAYVRRAPFNMWGSAYTIRNLERAIELFHRDTDYAGTVVIADLSRKSGGPFPPHKSHQSGRDVDIWLPMVEGAFEPERLGRGSDSMRKPELDEVDWLATWALMRALIETGAVDRIFLEWELQEYVYHAALELDATAEELDFIQWPNPPGSPGGILRNSDGHTKHMHVRFKCAPWEHFCV